jgi:AbrB family looped-hinge helix DNA binding protein
MVIPSKARKLAGIGQGDVLKLEVEGDGRISLIRLKRPKENPPRHGENSAVQGKASHR